MDAINRFREKPIIDAVPEKQTTVGDTAASNFINAENSSTVDKIEPNLPQSIDPSTFSSDPHLTQPPQLEGEVTPAQQLPDGSPVASDLSVFNIGDRKLSMDPNHFGIDLSKGGISARDLIGQILGVANQTPIEPTGGLGLALPGQSMKAAGMIDGIIAWIKGLFSSDAAGVATDAAMEKFGPPLGGEAMQLLNAPETIAKVTGDATDGLRGVQAYGTDTSGNALLKKVDEGNQYVNPEDSTPDVYLTPEQAKKVIELLKNVDVRPSNEEGATPITAEDLEGATPLDLFTNNPNLRFVTDRNPEVQEFVDLNEEALAARLGATGGDQVNPLDPDVAPLAPPTDIPESPTGPDDTGNPGKLG